MKVKEREDEMHKINLIKKFKIEKNQPNESFFEKSCSLLLLEEMFNVERDEDEEDDHAAFGDEYIGDDDTKAIEKEA